MGEEEVDTGKGTSLKEFGWEGEESFQQPEYK